MSGYLAVEAAIRDAPTEWTRTTFKRVTTQFKVPNTGSDESLLSLASTGVVSARLEMGGLGRQAPSDETIKSYWKVRPDQVVVNPMWLIGGSVGVSDVAGAVSPAYRVYTIMPGVHPRYIHHLLRSYPYMVQYRLLGRGDTTFDRSVGREDFEGLPLALPPLQVQRGIADFLDHQVALLDRAIALRRQQSLLLLEKLKVEVRRTLTGFGAGSTEGTGNRWFPFLPQDWHAMPLKYRWRVIDCKHRTPAYQDSGYPVVSTGDVTAGRLDLSRSSRFVSEADYLDLADLQRRPLRGDVVLQPERVYRNRLLCGHGRAVHHGTRCLPHYLSGRESTVLDIRVELPGRTADRP